MLSAILILAGSFQGQTYGQAHAEAVRTGKPMVAGVGCAPVNGDWHIALCRELEGYTAPCIVVAVPQDGRLVWRATLPPTATADDVRRVLAPPPKRKYNPYPAASVPDFTGPILRRLDSIRRVDC